MDFILINMHLPMLFRPQQTTFDVLYIQKIKHVIDQVLQALRKLRILNRHKDFKCIYEIQ